MSIRNEAAFKITRFTYKTYLTTALQHSFVSNLMSSFETIFFMKKLFMDDYGKYHT